jgi:uncharacterized membrane protein YqhA
MADAQPPQPPDAIDRAIPTTRYVFVLAVISLMVASLAMFVLGTYETFRAIYDALVHPEGDIILELRLHFVEVIDLFLLATILYVMAAGFIQLALGRPAPDRWLRVRSVHDLEVLLLGVIVTLLAVTALTSVLSGGVATEVLALSGAIALVIAAIGVFIWASGRREESD